MKNLDDSTVEFTASQGVELEARLVRLGRFEAVFELFGPDPVLRTSEVLAPLQIVHGGHIAYEGRATVASLVSVPGGVVVEARLDDPGAHLPEMALSGGALYEDFQRHWLAGYQVRSEFKVVVADVEIFLVNLRQWLDDVALGFQARGVDDAAKRERQVLEEVAPRVVAAFNALHERFEDIAAGLAPEARAVHQHFARRHLHPLFLCSPFGFRTYHKPLGYAGDYEMMNMIMRKSFEGKTLFAQAMHFWLVNQWPAESVRNRIVHLEQNLVTETARVVRTGRRARVLNLGCGPAWEVQEFLKESALSSEADFTLMDFNDETLRYTGGVLEELKRRHGRRTGVKMQPGSVQQLLRSALQGKPLAAEERFDFIYCAGLFDYLSDATCQAIVKLFFNWLQPDGLVVVANMNDVKPFRYMVEFMLDWHLIYRDSRFMASLFPKHPAAEGHVITEPTTVNLFTQVRKTNGG